MSPPVHLSSVLVNYATSLTKHWTGSTSLGSSTVKGVSIEFERELVCNFGLIIRVKRLLCGFENSLGMEQ